MSGFRCVPGRRLRRAGGVLASALWAAGCAGLAPLREPPPSATLDPSSGVTTRAEALAAFGPPAEVRASDVGSVLVYRRVVGVDANPNRHYGLDTSARRDRVERVLLYLDAEGRIVRWATEPE